MDNELKRTKKLICQLVHAAGEISIPQFMLEDDAALAISIEIDHMKNCTVFRAIKNDI